jgi:hypothetical protein
LSEKVEHSSQELSPFLITIMRTTAKADVLYSEANAEMWKKYHMHNQIFLNKLIAHFY